MKPVGAKEAQLRALREGTAVDRSGEVKELLRSVGATRSKKNGDRGKAPRHLRPITKGRLAGRTIRTKAPGTKDVKPAERRAARLEARQASERLKAAAQAEPRYGRGPAEAMLEDVALLKEAARLETVDGAGLAELVERIDHGKIQRTMEMNKAIADASGGGAKEPPSPPGEAAVAAAPRRRRVLPPKAGSSTVAHARTISEANQSKISRAVADMNEKRGRGRPRVGTGASKTISVVLDEATVEALEEARVMRAKDETLSEVLRALLKERLERGF